jgi:hypothetical protein
MKGLMARGMDGETAFEVAQRLEPIMSLKGKMELQQAKLQIEDLKARTGEKRADTQAQGQNTKDILAGTKPADPNVTPTVGSRLDRGAHLDKVDDAKVQKLSGAFKAAGMSHLTNDAKSKEVDFYAQQEIAGIHSWKTNFRGKEGQALLTAVAARVPSMAEEMNISPQEIGTIEGQRKAMTSAMRLVQQRSAGAELFSSKIEKDIASLKPLIDKASMSNPLFINKPINYWKDQSQQYPELAKLSLQMRQVGIEYERLMTSSGMSQGQLLATAQEDAKKLMNGDMAPNIALAVIEQMQQDIRNATSTNREKLAEMSGAMSQLGKGGAGTGKVVDFSSLK